MSSKSPMAWNRSPAIVVTGKPLWSAKDKDLLATQIDSRIEKAEAEKFLLAVAAKVEEWRAQNGRAITDPGKPRDLVKVLGKQAERMRDALHAVGLNAATSDALNRAMLDLKQPARRGGAGVEDGMPDVPFWDDLEGNDGLPDSLMRYLTAVILICSDLEMAGVSGKQPTEEVGKALAMFVCEACKQVFGHEYRLLGREWLIDFVGELSLIEGFKKKIGKKIFNHAANFVANGIEEMKPQRTRWSRRQEAAGRQPPDETRVGKSSALPTKKRVAKKLESRRR